MILQQSQPKETGSEVGNHKGKSFKHIPHFDFKTAIHLLGDKSLCLWAPLFNLSICPLGFFFFFKEPSVWDLYLSPYPLNAFTFILETRIKVRFYLSLCYFEIEHLAG